MVMKKLTKKEEQEILSRFAQYLKDKEEGKHDLTFFELAWITGIGLFIGVLLSKLIEWL